ncbi:hypothetical protein VTO73DRAFT_11518 [Trametes versicolor]
MDAPIVVGGRQVRSSEKWCIGMDIHNGHSDLPYHPRVILIPWEKCRPMLRAARGDRHFGQGFISGKRVKSPRLAPSARISINGVASTSNHSPPLPPAVRLGIKRLMRQ